MVRMPARNEATTKEQCIMSTTTKTSKAAAVPPASPGSTTVATIQQAMALIVQAFALIQGILRGPFTARENRAMVKGRHAVKVLAPTLIQEAINKPNLVPDQMTPAQMQEETAVAAAFLQFANQLAGIFDRVDGTNRSMQSELVKVALEIYALAERYPSDTGASELVSQMKAALANGPRFPSKKVTPIAKPVTMHVPAEAAAAAQAAVNAQQAASSTGSSTASASSNGTSSASTSNSSPAAPSVPLYGPNGPMGTVAPTNTGTNGSNTPHS
jgi:hypothetical protein